jgi:cyclic pyranopterin phosphate synthase
MVDVSAKTPTKREAVASGLVRVGADTFRALTEGNVPKGDVLGTARIAGIMAAKQVGSLIPLCHPLPVEHVAVEFRLVDDPPGVEITATASITAKTGVEMEAMTAVSVAALTIYDMCKGMDKAIEIDGIRLVRKSGGKSGLWQRESTG